MKDSRVDVLRRRLGEYTRTGENPVVVDSLRCLIEHYERKG